MSDKDEKEPNSVQVLGHDGGDKKYVLDEKRSARSVHAHEPEAVLASDLVVLAADVDAIYDRAIALTLEETTEILEDAWTEHHDDPNFPTAVKDKIEYFLSGDSSTLENYDLLLEEMKIEAGLIRFSSPYPEVRSVVKSTDDFNEVASTFRAWVIGTIWCGLGSFINQFFSLRQPSFTLSTNEVQLLSYPLGKFMEWTLPTKTLFTWRGYNFTLNPGRFTEKEHMLITIMANVGMLTPYSVNVLIVQQLDIFYGQKWASAFGYQILTGLSIQMIGMGFAGMTRRFIVYPEHCIWLLNLATIALNKSFHSDSNPVANGWHISRLRFFLVCFGASFCWYWLPGSLVQCISYFNWISWINPTSVAVSAVFGFQSGLGLGPIPAFDWSQWKGSTVLVQPFFSTANQLLGMVISAPIIIGFWYGNVLNTGYFPMVSNRIYANTGAAYNVSRILNDKKELDLQKYTSYSQPYMAASNIVLYAAFFAAYSSVITHTFLYHRKEISNGFKAAYKSIRAGQKGNLAFKDWHNQTMAQYEEVPEWWYLLFTVFAVVLGILGLTLYPTNTSVSSIFFGIALCIVFVIPIGIITSITGAQITLNVFAEFIGGLIYPGNALAMNYFKSYGVVSCMNAIQFAQDLKLAHYLKIGQRYTFIVQVYGSIVACLVATSILNYQMGLEKICQIDQPQHFYCNGEATFFTATVFWGTLGPTRVFGKGGVYTMLLFGFLIGAVLPFPFYFIAKRWPKSIFGQVHVVVALYGVLAWGPSSTLACFWPGCVLAWVFMVYIKRKYLAWWSKYNYVLAVGVGSAIPICAILIFGIISSTAADDVVSRWRTNTLMNDNCDGKGCHPFTVPADPGYIGPTPGDGAWR